MVFFLNKLGGPCFSHGDFFKIYCWTLLHKAGGESVSMFLFASGREIQKDFKEPPEIDGPL